MMTTADELTAVDEVVHRYLRRAGINRPAVDPLRVAERLGIGAQWDGSLPGRGERRLVGGRSLILVRPDERDEREHFAIAHEIGEERAVADILELLDDGATDARRREQLANLFAGRLLCPRPWFNREVERVGFHLRKLKRTFHTASHEVIARQFLQDDVPCVITIVDQGRVCTRLGNVAHDRRLSPLEQRVWERCHRTSRRVRRRQDGMCVEACAVHERDWKREILRTTEMN